MDEAILNSLEFFDNIITKKYDEINRKKWIKIHFISISKEISYFFWFFFHRILKKYSYSFFLFF
jgi:hypothetical protein